MNSSTMDFRFGVTLGLALCAACTEEGSLGEYPESSGTAADDGASDDDPTESGTQDSATEDSASSDSATGTATSSSDTASETGNPEACMEPGNCSEFSPCDGANLCGTLDSLFDENGCIRTECQDDEACAEGERCYRAMDFGGCAPSGVFCEDDPELQTCLCGSNPECGGGFCVPEDLYPTASPLPQGVTFVSATCASLGSKDLYLQWGGFGVCDLDERLFALVINTAGTSDEAGEFEIDNSTQEIGWYSVSDGSQAEVLTATGVLLYDGETASGSVTATLAPNVDGIQVIAGDFDMPLCGEDPPCI